MVIFKKSLPYKMCIILPCSGRWSTGLAYPSAKSISSKDSEYLNLIFFILKSFTYHLLQRAHGHVQEDNYSYGDILWTV